MLLFSIDLPLILTSCTKEKVIHRACPKANTKAATVLKMRVNWARRLELPYKIRLAVEVYARVCGTSSPSRSFREPVHLSAFLFASFPNAYRSTINSILFCACQQSLH